MDGLFAKRVLIALAKMLSFDSICRSNYTGGYCLKLIPKHGRRLPMLIKYPNETFMRVFTFKSSKWVNILKDLEGKSLGNLYNNGMPIVIEQLIIDLELEGFLNKA